MEKIVDIIVNDVTFIRISTENAKKDLFWYDTITVDLYSDQNCWTLFNGFAIDIALPSIDAFSGLLTNKLVAHPSVCDNLGYLKNEYFHLSCEAQEKDDRFVFESVAGCESPWWVGTKHFPWSFGQKDIGACFFEKDAKFFIEIVPLYPWFFSDPESGENYIPYQEFIKNYKSLALFEVPRSTVEQLLETFKEFQAILEANDDRFKDRLEDMGIFVVKAGDDSTQQNVNEIAYCKPKNGQRALDNSLEIRESDLRIAIEDDAFVKLRVTHKETREYQGYLADWKELDSKTQKILHNAGWVITEVE